MSTVGRTIVRWRENSRSAAIHADSGDGTDFTFCGFTTNEATGEDDQPELISVTRGKISCEHCLAIIRYAKAIPARYLAAAKTGGA